jgi:hypothetical protein
MRNMRFVLLFIPGLLFAGGCELTDDGGYVAPITNYEKIAGTWKLKTLKQADEIAKASLAKPTEMTLTTELEFNTFQITFNTDEEYNPTTFEVTGTSPGLFLGSGYWSLDNPFVNTDGTATNILLYSDEAKTQLKDKLNLVKIPGVTKTLDFKLIRSVDNTPFVSYLYQLVPPTK